MLHVLIVDDDPEASKPLAKNLTRSRDPSCQVTIAATADEARAAVQAADLPFDIFLIDQRLGRGPDGITVMQELLQLSPEAGAIIITGLDEADIRLRAYQAGARNYLVKPFDPQELQWILRAFEQWRTEQHERVWLRVLNETAERVLYAMTRSETAEIIVAAGQRLGFERVRLWLLDDDQTMLIGISQIGNDGLDHFFGLRMPIQQSQYAHYALKSHDPVRLSRQIFGPSYLESLEPTFTPSLGELMYIPLWAGKRCLGLLSLDNTTTPLSIPPALEEQLKLFGHQAAAALERARLSEQEARTSRELAVLNAIGKRVIARASTVDLDDLLTEVYAQIRELMVVDGFVIALLNLDSGTLDYPLRIVGKTPHGPSWSEPKEGLLAYLIEHDEELFAPQGTADFRKPLSIQLLGTEAKSWMGTLLRVDGQAIGALAVEIINGVNRYRQEDWRIFQAITEQVAGAIHIARLKAEETRKRHQLDVLHHATEVMMELAQRGEPLLWRATLTTVTAGQALGFNRASIFLAQENGARLRGCLGIGHFDRAAAERAWEKDKAAHLDVDQYFDMLRNRNYTVTPVEEAVRDWEIVLGDDANAFSEAMSQQQRFVVRASEARQRLPQVFISQFGITDYAILPLRAGSKVMGLIVVDNIHTAKPLNKSALDHLELLLTQATLILESLRQREAKDQLINLNHAVMTQLGSRPLGDTLQQVCQTARTVTEADYVVIYPFKSGQHPYEYDLDNMALDRQKSDIRPQLPRPIRMTTHIVKAEKPLVLGDVSAHLQSHPERNGTVRQRIRTEGIRACIGTALYDASTREPLGVLYLNYRAPQEFTDQDVRQAEAFASIAALSIRNTRDREAQLEVLRNVLHQALQATDEEQVIASLIDAGQQLLACPDARVRVFLRAWQPPKQADQEPLEVRYQYSLGTGHKPGRETVTDIFRGITGWVLTHGRPALVPDVTKGPLAAIYYPDPGDSTSSELDVPIMLNGQVIGVFNIEAPKTGTFTTAHRGTIERLAVGAALALDNVRRQQRLHNIFQAVKAITTATELNATLESIKNMIHTAMPDLTALTIWYADPATKQIVLGSYFGVHDQRAMEHVTLEEGSVLWKIMYADAPLFVTDAAHHPMLKGGFTEAEEVASVAAFPLHAQNRPVGAMFFNYRQRHVFSDQERSLFHVFAEIVAACLNDAALLQQARDRARHLQAAQDITQAIGTTLDLDHVLRNIMEKLRDLFPQTQTCVLLYDPNEDDLIFTPASYTNYTIDHPLYHSSARISVHNEGPESSIAAVLAKQSLVSKQVELMNLADVATDQRYLGLNSSTRSELCLTLMSGEQLLGVLALESSEHGTFEGEHEALIRSIGQQISIAIDRANRSADLQFKTTIAAAMIWAAQIAHDINREVGYILSHTHLILLKEQERLSNTVKEHLQEIDASVKRLALTSLESTPEESESLEPLEFDLFVEQCFQEIVNQPGIKLEWNARCPGVQVRVSPYGLKDALRNLVNNAVEAMKESGTIRVATRLKGEHRVEIRIADTGPGIDPKLPGVLFQELTSTKGKKRGFGLMVVRHLIESMGGKVVCVPPEPREGAVFAITLPVVDLAAEVTYEH